MGAGLSMLRWFAAVNSCVVLAMACSGFRPPLGFVEASSVDLSNSIEYRALTRADFQSSERPDVTLPRYELRAYTCTWLIPTPDTWMNSVRQQTPGGEPAFGVTFKALGFRALMNRNCSWWDDESPEDAASMLEHEQIHFAIFELGARGMNANTPQIVREIESKNLAASDTGAIKRAQTELDRALVRQGALDKARNDAFDKETSFGTNPERQKLWLAQINAELVATAAWASTPRAYYQR